MKRRRLTIKKKKKKISLVTPDLELATYETLPGSLLCPRLACKQLLWLHTREPVRVCAFAFPEELYFFEE